MILLVGACIQHDPTRVLSIHAQPLADDAFPEPDEGERLADGGSARTARARAVRDQPDDRSPSGGAANVQLRPLEL